MNDIARDQSDLVFLMQQITVFSLLFAVYSLLLDIYVLLSWLFASRLDLDDQDSLMTLIHVPFSRIHR